MKLFSWQLIRTLRAKVREQEEQLRHLSAQLISCREFTQDGGEWGRFLKGHLQKMRDALATASNAIHGLTKGQERLEVRIMATIQDMKDALDEQNQTILAELDQINKKMDELKTDPAKLDEIVAGIKANTDTIKGIVEEDLPDPEPTPEPVPPGPPGTTTSILGPDRTPTPDTAPNPPATPAPPNPAPPAGAPKSMGAPPTTGVGTPSAKPADPMKPDKK